MQAEPLAPREGFTAVGVVTRAHGLHGELRVQAFAASAPNLQRGRRVFVRGERRTVTRARPDRGAWILQLSGLADRTAAEPLAGELIEAADADVRRDDSDSYFVHELIGLRVVTTDGRNVGLVTEVLQGGANDVYVAQGDTGEVLIPAVAGVVSAIDLSARVMCITPLAGMLDDTK